MHEHFKLALVHTVQYIYIYMYIYIYIYIYIYSIVCTSVLKFSVNIGQMIAF